MGFQGRNDGAAAVRGGAPPLNLSFGNFEFEDMKSVGRRGGGVRELAALLRHAKRQTDAHAAMLGSGEGLGLRRADLLSTATRRAAGVKVRDDPRRLAKALAKRRNKRRSSAKKWAGRLQKLQQSVNTVVEDRTMARQAARMRRENKEKGKQQKREAKRVPGTAVQKRAKKGSVRGGKAAATKQRKPKHGRK